MNSEPHPDLRAAPPLHRAAPAHLAQAAAITIYLQERWVTCCMCCEDADHTEPADRYSVPIWNGEPTKSTAPAIDGYMPACPRCYLRWDQWDNKS